MLYYNSQYSDLRIFEKSHNFQWLSHCKQPELHILSTDPNYPRSYLPDLTNASRPPFRVLFSFQSFSLRLESTEKYLPTNHPRSDSKNRIRIPSEKCENGPLKWRPFIERTVSRVWCPSTMGAPRVDAELPFPRGLQGRRGRRRRSSVLSSVCNGSEGGPAWDPADPWTSTTGKSRARSWRVGTMVWFFFWLIFCFCFFVWRVGSVMDVGDGAGGVLRVVADFTGWVLPFYGRLKVEEYWSLKNWLYYSNIARIFVLPGRFVIKNLYSYEFSIENPKIMIIT